MSYHATSVILVPVKEKVLFNYCTKPVIMLKLYSLNFYVLCVFVDELLRSL